MAKTLPPADPRRTGISGTVKWICLLGVLTVAVGAGLPTWGVIQGDDYSKRIRNYTLTYYRAPEHAVPPRNALDPYDAFQKDAQGDLLITRARADRYSAYAGADFHAYYLRTKAGNNTLVYQPTPARRLQVKTNCHGLTFLAGEYWLMDNQVELVLRDAGWDKVRLENVQAGDIAIYRDLTGAIVHSAKVVGKDPRDRILVDSKNGYDPREPSVWAYKPVAE